MMTLVLRILVISPSTDENFASRRLSHTRNTEKQQQSVSLGFRHSTREKTNNSNLRNVTRRKRTVIDGVQSLILELRLGKAWHRFWSKQTADQETLQRLMKQGDNLNNSSPCHMPLSSSTPKSHVEIIHLSSTVSLSGARGSDCEIL